jgi:hypothetical protein
MDSTRNDFSMTIDTDHFSARMRPRQIVAAMTRRRAASPSREKQYVLDAAWNFATSKDDVKLSQRVEIVSA